VKYFIQDKRSYVGNSIVWWGKNRSGYTTNIDLAGQYTEEEAKRICQDRKTDIAYPVPYIMGKLQKTCDMQYIDSKKARWKRAIK
jgi:hypothetical protein